MMTNNCGVYRIKNTITGDFYIGSSSDIRGRLWNHRYMLSNAAHHNPYLQNVWNKYGAQAFEFSTILLCDVENKLYYEQVLLDGLKPTYNMAKDVAAPMQGRPCSEEAKRKISAVHKGKVMSEESRKKMSEAQKGNTNAFGHKCTDEARVIMSEAKKGKPSSLLGTHLSEERKRKISEAGMGHLVSDETRAKLSGELNHNFGKHRSNETRAKISDGQKGNTNALGYKHTAEACEKIREAQQGRHPSDETRAKMSESAKLYWAQQKNIVTEV